jgi:hypothetical protein
MQGVNSVRLKYILISEHVSFIPDNIMHNCKIIHVPKPTACNYNKCSQVSHQDSQSQQQKLSFTASITVSEKNIILQDTMLPFALTKKYKREQEQERDVVNGCPHEMLCNTILDNLKNTDNLKFLAFRDVLYDILIYNHDLGECMWYILNNLINCGLLQVNDLSDILIETYMSLQYFNNNYRPIYHLENYMYNIISIIHGYGIIKK